MYEGVGQYDGEFLPLASGGVFDPLGEEIAPLRGAQIQLRSAISIRDQTQAQMEAQERELRALWGVRDRLYRYWPESGRWEWCMARMIGYHANRQALDKYLDIDFTWQMISPHWYGNEHGEDWKLDEGYYLDAGKVFDASAGVTFNIDTGGDLVNVTNGGNVTVRDVIITVTAHETNAITAIEIECNGGHLTWSGTLAPTTSLVFDCGAYTVKKPSLSDEYANFALGANHKIDDWIRLEPGSNSVLITLTGNSATVTFAFSDGVA